jgi:hypothetical protein
MNGLTATHFGSDTELTRGMVVTVLGRLNNVDISLYSGKAYSDIDTGAYYAPYVAWASDNGIALGYDDGTFKPDKLVARQEMVSFIIRYTEFLKVDLAQTRVYNVFADQADIAGYAVGYVQTAYNARLVNGKSDSQFAPLATSLRVEFAAIIHRLDVALNG